MSFYKEYRRVLFGKVPSPWWLLYNGYHELRHGYTPLRTDTCDIRKAVLLWPWFAFWRGGGKILKVWMVAVVAVFVAVSYFATFLLAHLLVILFAIVALLLVLALAAAVLYLATDYSGVGDFVRNVVGSIWRFTRADDAWDWFVSAKLWKVPLWAILLIIIDIPLYYLIVVKFAIAPFLWLTYINVMLLTPLGKKVFNYFFSTPAGKSVAHVADVGNDLYSTVKDRLCLPAKWVD